MENMEKWNSMARPPLSALKTIKGGRLAGMSNISPQWRWQIMTQTFGMVGIGWKYTIEKRWTNPGANDEHFCFVEISLYVKVDGEWGAAIPGSGGSMLVSKEKAGYHNNDEAFKMAETDALGTAMAKLGVAADIYLGTFDGSKYNTPDVFSNQINTKKEATKAVEKISGSPEESEDGYSPETAITGNLDEDFPPIKFTVKAIRNSADHISALSKQTGKPVPEILAFIKTLDSTQEYSINTVVKLLKGE